MAVGVGQEQPRAGGISGGEAEPMPHAVRPQHVAAFVDEDVEWKACLLDVGADGTRVLRHDPHELNAPGPEGGNVAGELAEPAAAVRSPGAAMKREEQPPAREIVRERVNAPLLIGKREARSVDQLGALHQNNFTSTISPDSTMSTWAGISKNPSARDMLVMSPDALNAGVATPSAIRTV